MNAKKMQTFPSQLVRRNPSFTEFPHKLSVLLRVMIMCSLHDYVCVCMCVPYFTSSF